MLAHDLALLGIPLSFDRLYGSGDNDFLFACRMLRNAVNETNRRESERHG